MSTVTAAATSAMAIFRRNCRCRVGVLLRRGAAQAILRLNFSPSDRVRMNALAAKNRKGKLSAGEAEELDNYIRVGQTLGILQSKARRSLKRPKERHPPRQGKS